MKLSTGSDADAGGAAEGAAAAALLFELEQMMEQLWQRLWSNLADFLLAMQLFDNCGTTLPSLMLNQVLLLP